MRNRPVVTAPKDTPCGWTAYGETGTRLVCHSGRPAIHVLTEGLPVAQAGTALCAFHSPFDPTDEERQATRVDVLTELLTLDTAVRTAEQLARFHKLSAPMVGVLTEVAKARGLVGAWAMRNVVVRDVQGATMATVKALIKRDILAVDLNEGNQSGTGGTDYVLTERGREVAEALGCPVVDLPTAPEVIATVVALHTQAGCATGCEAIIARGVVMLPAGGDVCYGCGSIFTRPNGQAHPSLDVISLAVVARNQAKGN